LNHDTALPQPALPKEAIAAGEDMADRPPAFEKGNQGMLSWFNGRRMLRMGVVAVALSAWPVRASSAAEIVRFRHVKPATVHFLNSATAVTYEKRLQDLGCKTRISWHWGHTDLTYQCEDWHEMRFNSHEETREWMKLLSALGFEAGHYH